jgi:DNA-binding MarR family transcriptional regulator
MDPIMDFAKDLGIISNHFKAQMNCVHFEHCNMKDYVTINYLFEQKKASMQQLSQILQLTPSATTTHVDKLVKNAILKREYDEDDRRKVYILLDKKGEKIGKFLYQKHIDISKQMLSSLDKHEQEQLCSLIKKISNTLEKND